jgi:hypothetical protein
MQEGTKVSLPDISEDFNWEGALLALDSLRKEKQQD